MLTKFIAGLVVLAGVSAHAYNMDLDDIKTCNNKQFLVKLWNSHLDYEAQKALILKKAQEVGLAGQVSFSGRGLTDSKELVIILQKPRTVAAASPQVQAERFSKFKKMLDKVDSKNEISYAECNIVFDEH